MLNENEKRIDDAQAKRDETEKVVKHWFDASEVAKKIGDKKAFMNAKAEYEWAGEQSKQAELAYQRVMVEVGEEVRAAKEVLLASHKKAADVDVLKGKILGLAKQASEHELAIRALRHEAFVCANITRSRAELARDVARELKVTAIVAALDDDDVATMFDVAVARFADQHQQNQEAAE